MMKIFEIEKLFMGALISALLMKVQLVLSDEISVFQELSRIV